MRVKFYLTSSGRSPVEEFILALPKETRMEIADAISLLDTGSKLEMPLSRNFQVSDQDFMNLDLEMELGKLELFII